MSITLKDYRRQLVALQKVTDQVLSATTELLSQLEKESRPEHKTVRNVSQEERDNLKRLLVDSGLFTEEEVNSDKGLIPAIINLNLTEDQIKSTIEELLPKKENFVNKSARLIWSLKNEHLYTTK